LHRLLDRDANTQIMRRVRSDDGTIAEPQAAADDDGCAPAKAVPAARAARIDAILAAADAVRAPAPDHLRELVHRAHRYGGFADLAPPNPDRGDAEPAEPAEPADATPADAPADPEPGFLAREQAAAPRDLAKLLASSYGWYVEWPHIDGRFIQVFHTIPGYLDRGINGSGEEE